MEQQATITKTKAKTLKAIVWDMDNTLWNGVLVEDEKVDLRENMKTIIQTLDQRGILHSIASKNDHDNVMAKLAEFGLVEYFLFPQINWGPKSESLKIIKERLNIGMDAIAFIDDQAFEREEVGFENKEVSIYDVDIIDNILNMPEFKPRFITEESSKRRQMYVDDQARKEEEERWGDQNNKAFLASQEMKFRIAPATVDDLQRVEELTVRTNQLNATGYTYSYDELESFIDATSHKLYVAELTDKYGSYGKIGVTLIECQDDTWTLKLLLMSCRVMSRGVGNVLLHFLINLAKKHNVRLQAEFLPTDRNRLMYMTYKFSGFKEAGQLEGGGTLLEHPLEAENPYPEYLEMNVVE